MPTTFPIGDMATITKATAIMETMFGNDGCGFLVIHEGYSLAPSGLGKVTSITAIVPTITNMSAGCSTIDRPSKAGIP